MFNSIEKLITDHGISSAVITIKPHLEGIAATINLIPDPKAIVEQQMQNVLAAPLIIIGKDNMLEMTTETMLTTIREQLKQHEYLSPEAIADRIANTTSTPPKDKSSQKTDTTPPPMPFDTDIFNQPSL